MIAKSLVPFLAAVLLVTAAAHAHAEATAGDPLAGEGVTVLKAEQLRKLYGERRKLIETVTVKGHKIRMDVFPDGRLFGNNTSLVGTNAAGAGNSNGNWRVDEEKNQVCHEWGNHHWTGGCYFVRSAGPDSYEWFRSAGQGGTRFTIVPQ
jgi:hypothetical protein